MAVGPGLAVAGQAALRKGGEGVIIALETFQNQEGDSALPSAAGQERPLAAPHPHPLALCALHRGGGPGPALAGPPRAHGRGPVGQRV